MDNNCFQKWLISKKELREKSARDVVSRLNRAKKFINFTKNSNVEKVINDLESNRRFSHITLTVKSQIRRAVKLYCMYENR